MEWLRYPASNARMQRIGVQPLAGQLRSYMLSSVAKKYILKIYIIKNIVMEGKRPEISGYQGRREHVTSAGDVT